MASLTETAYHTRRLIKFSLIGLCLLLIFKSAYGRAKEYWQEHNPPPPPKPTLGFGVLPKIPFPKQEKQTFNFKLETITGSLPSLTDQAKVYFIPKGVIEFSSLDRAKVKAAQLGFSTKPIKITESVYRWVKRNTLLSSLEMDILNGNFSITRNWQNNFFLISLNDPLPEEKALSQARSFLSRAGLLPESLKNGQPVVSYLKFTPPNLIPAVSFSEADLSRVDLFPAPLDDLPRLTVNPCCALVSFLLKDASHEEEKFLEVKYQHQEILKERFETYPLKTTAQAWSELRDRQAFIIPGKANPEETIIREVSLAYFDAQEPSHYLMPIFVFKGDSDFYAYVSAISPQWVQE